MPKNLQVIQKLLRVQEPFEMRAIQFMIVNVDSAESAMVRSLTWCRESHDGSFSVEI